MDDFNNSAMTKLSMRVVPSVKHSTYHYTVANVDSKGFNLLRECFARYVNCRVVL